MTCLLGLMWLLACQPKAKTGSKYGLLRLLTRGSGVSPIFTAEDLEVLIKSSKAAQEGVSFLTPTEKRPLD